MNILTVNIEETKMQSLELAAKQMNISVDELVNSLVDGFLKEKEQRFQAARTYVRGRYQELYKRFAADIHH